MDRGMMIIWLISYLVIAVVSYLFGSRDGFRQGTELSAELYEATIEFIDRLKEGCYDGEPEES